jgi:hypothetical protein
LPRRRARSSLAFVLVAALAATAAGCSAGTQAVEDIKEGHFLDKPLFVTPEWAESSSKSRLVHLNPQQPVKPEELVDAAGQCAAEEAPVAQAAPVPAPQAQAEQPEEKTPTVSPAAARAEAQVGSMAGDLASAPMPQGPPPAPPQPRKPKKLASAKPDDFMDQLQPAGTAGMPGTPGAPVMGGIALGMTECQAVHRAGHPSHVTIEAGKKGERQVVLTYLSGPWPGIYTFDSGRLKVVDANPDQLNPAEPVKVKKKRKKKAKATAHTAPKKEDVYVQ